MSLASLRGVAQQAARSGLLSAIRSVTRRTPVLLPAEAGSARLLDARAPYRVVGDRIDIEVRPAHAGDLSVAILSHVQQGPAETLGTFAPLPIEGHCQLSLLLGSGALTTGTREVGRLAGFVAPRRFTTELVLRSRDHGTARRRLGHYLAAAVDDASYFTGAHYHDYDAQAAGDVQYTMAQLDRWDASGPLLDIGCATGLLLDACARRGLEVTGLDTSEWAVQQARARVGADRVVRANLDDDAWRAVLGARQFKTVVLNAVLEHVARPERLLHDVASLVEPGGLLFVTTANADSLTNLLFGDDWEGLADPTHKSAHRISPSRLRAWLGEAGWRVEHLVTRAVWDDNPDPVHACLRDAAAYDARFNQLLVQYERGDFLECVARRVSA